MRSHRLIACAALVAATLAPPAARGQTTYSYTLIATTGGTSPFAGLFAPSVNAAGTAAFGATLTAGGQGVFTSNGTTTTTIAQTGTTFSTFRLTTTDPILPAISPTSNAVAFFANLTGGGQGIFRGDGATTTTIASTPTFATFNTFPAINSAGTVSFTAGLPAGTQQVLAGTGTTTTPIATSGTTVPSFAGPTAINAAGTVAFIANFSNGSQQVLVGNGGPVSPIATTGTAVTSFAGPVSINGSGTVAFVGTLAGGGQAVFAGNTSTVTTIASTGTSVTGFGNFASINASNQVAFLATLSGGGQEIFVGNGTTAIPVIKTGDALAGSTVTSLALGSFAFNDLGQVAFAAGLANGRQGVFVATPVPEPAAVLTAAAAGIALAGAVRRGRRGTAGRIVTRRRDNPDMSAFVA